MAKFIFSRDSLDKDLRQILSKLSSSSQEYKVLVFIKNAIEHHITDIHVEPTASNRLHIRYRMDGYLQLGKPGYRVSLNQQCIVLLKELAEIDKLNKQMPQQGSFEIKNQGRLVTVEVATIPVVDGEKIVIHLIPENPKTINLRALGFTHDQLMQVEEKIQKHYGMIFVTGLAQSGVTSTAYAMIKRRMSPNTNIITLEDPVEKIVHGVNQVQVRADIGLTCASGLRAFLRQDPDVVYCGAKHDEETLEICVRAALTGRMIINSFYAWDTAGALASILEMVKSQSHHLAESLTLIVNQRLVRQLCLQCKKVHRLSAKEKKNYGITSSIIYKADPKGCIHCYGTGYSGQVGVFELLEVNEEIRSAIHQQMRPDELKSTIDKQEMISLAEAGIYKVNEGLTSIEEILRVQL